MKINEPNARPLSELNPGELFTYGGHVLMKIDPTRQVRQDAINLMNGELLQIGGHVRVTRKPNACLTLE